MIPDFADSAALERWLAAQGVDTAAWGAGQAKSVADLWQELLHGESILADDPPRRLVQVAQVTIRRAGQILLEVEQEFGNGQRRARHLPPSEKLQPGESYAAAAVRCLIEELGVTAEDITLLAGGYRQEQRLMDSPSYPGLLAHYTFHHVAAAVAGLPGHDFWRENGAYAHGDPVRRQRWGWRSDGRLT